MIRLYNVLREFLYLSNPEETQLATPETEITEGEVDANLGLNKALDTYRKLIEKKDGAEPLSEKDQAALENRIKEIEDREVVEKIEDHDPVEIPCEKGKITIGPPTLTRFEQARIMGARAPFRMRHRDHSAAGHIRVAHNHIFQVDRTDPFTTRFNQLFGAILDHQIPIRTD